MDAHDDFLHVIELTLDVRGRRLEPDGGYRETVRVAVHRLEEQGMLANSRPRSPGFGPRLVRLADDCSGHEELQALIVAVPVASPDTGQSLVKAVDDFSEKTKV